MKSPNYLNDDIERYLTTCRFNAVVCTTNEVVKRNGELVMGAGIAKVFRDTFPILPYYWGEQLTQRKKRGDNGLLMMTHCSNVSNYKIGPYLIAFPTKYHYKDSSPLELVERSMLELYLLADIMNFSSVLLPKPGCSNGGLSWEKDVFPAINVLLDERFTIIDKIN